ncbi:MAG TPA: 4-alpha-glucanotransferase [Thermomicrobiales bacterium]|nr:4-alpha-glucanotransferase [Thermomicrobiales bacterium]
MRFPRESGILLHPTSLPGPHGIGDFGPSAFRFIDWLEAAGQRLWQVMPLGPTGYGDSPYASPSAFAGNPLLISLPWLHGDGLLTDQDLAGAPAFAEDHVEFEAVAAFKGDLLRRAFDAFRRGAASELRGEFEQFSQDQRYWLDSYALFMAVKRAHGMASWHDWDEPIRLRSRNSVEEWSNREAQEIRFQKFVQFLFNRQWLNLKAYANARGVRVIGDIPIFVAEDSADVWSAQALFKLDSTGVATEVAGVPPDPFSDTGQIWGNPVYDWETMRKDDFGWWSARIGRMLTTVDVVRIDHFRGFAAAWLVPAGAATAAEGHWERAPGGDVFAAIRRAHGDLPIIIEDLGVITPDVISLREVLGFPGMNVLQFAFEHNPANVYLPHNYRPDAVVYTATHDNQTTVGWFQSRSPEDRAAVQRYLGRDGSDIAWDVIRVALASVAQTAILSMQDVLRLDDRARMNVPGKPEGNWSWRCREDQLASDLATGLRDMTWLYGRLGDLNATSDPNPWDYTHPHSGHRAADPRDA